MENRSENFSSEPEQWRVSPESHQDPEMGHFDDNFDETSPSDRTKFIQIRTNLQEQSERLSTTSERVKDYVPTPKINLNNLESSGEALSLVDLVNRVQRAKSPNL